MCRQGCAPSGGPTGELVPGLSQLPEAACGAWLHAPSFVLKASSRASSSLGLALTSYFLLPRTLVRSLSPPGLSRLTSPAQGRLTSSPNPEGRSSLPCDNIFTVAGDQAMDNCGRNHYSPDHRLQTSGPRGNCSYGPPPQTLKSKSNCWVT